MKQLEPSVFLVKAESGEIQNIFCSTKRFYGFDYSYDFTRASQGKIRELVWALIPEGY